MTNSLITVDGKELDFLPRPNKKQKAFITAWLEPSSPTFGNAYKSAIAAGFRESYARVITGNAKNMLWVQQAKDLLVGRLDPEHIYVGLQEIALNGQYARDRVRALELMAKIKGMFIDRLDQNISVNFTNSVPRPIVDVVVDTPTTHTSHPNTDT